MIRTTEDVDDRSVAVIGLACRFPGSREPEQLWELLTAGADATSATPLERYDAEALYCEHPRPGSIGNLRAGYVDGAAEFDAEFFGMSVTEAAELDPQQRLLLMTVWEALEDAGIPPDALEGSPAGVYVGNAQSDYLELQRRQGTGQISPSFMNNYRSLLAGRLSYAFDLRGPSVVVDSACSSSLVAVHTAVQSLRAGEVPLAIAGGVNLKLLPDEAMLMTQAGTLARDGRSKFADATGDGYSPSDGSGVVVLKSLADAMADGDRVRAVIQGSAVGNDGRVAGTLLAPSVHGQIEVLERAYADAGVAPAEVDFVEAHGTASAVEDAVELGALGQVLGADRPRERPLLVGSVKTNIGHSQAAAGIAGLIKTVLCLEHGQVPASLHFDTPNPLVVWDDLPLTVPVQTHRLPDRGTPTIAGVSGQGMSCLYAHLVVRAASAPTASSPTGPEHAGLGRAGPLHPAEALPPTGTRYESPPEAYVLALSARSADALADLARSYADYLSPDGRGSGFALRDICCSAATRRQHHAHRMVVVGSSHAEMVTALRDEGPARGSGSAGVLEPGTAQAEAAERYLARLPVDWDSVFGPEAAFVPLPTYPWQLQPYWLGEGPGADTADGSADAVLRRHARTGFTDDSALSDIGIDSLSMMRIVAELARDRRYEVDITDLAELHTVGAFRHWFARLEVQAV